MSNLGLDECFAAAGGKILRAGVGDRYVLEMMLAHDLNVGGEQSGHVILRDHNTTGDGLVTALELLRIMKPTGEPLSKLRLGMRKYPQLLVNVKVRERIPLEQIARSDRRGERRREGAGRKGPRAAALLGHRAENPAAGRDARGGACCSRWSTACLCRSGSIWARRTRSTSWYPSTLGDGVEDGCASFEPPSPGGRRLPESA